MVEAQEGGRGGYDFVWGIGEAAVGGAVCEHGVWGGEAVDFDAHEGEGGPACESPGDAADGDEDGGHLEGADEGGEAHACCEEEMGVLPGGEEVWFVFIDGFQDGSDGWGAAGSEFSAILVGGLDGQGEEDRRSEGNDGKDNEREGADTADVAEGVFGSRGVGVGMVAEVDFADPRCAVEEEGEPAWEGQQMLSKHG